MRAATVAMPLLVLLNVGVATAEPPSGRVRVDGNPSAGASTSAPLRGSWLSVSLSCVRECTPAEEAASAKPIPADLSRLVGSKRVVTIKGRLVPGEEECLLGGGTSCSFEWVLAPRTDCPDWKIAIRHEPAFFRRQPVALECAAGDLGGAGDKIIVKGRLREAGDKILATDLCRVASDAANARAIAALLANRAKPAPVCPRLVKPSVPERRRSPEPAPALRSTAEQLNL